MADWPIKRVTLGNILHLLDALRKYGCTAVVTQLFNIHHIVIYIRCTINNYGKVSESTLWSVNRHIYAYDSTWKSIFLNCSCRSQCPSTATFNPLPITDLCCSAVSTFTVAGRQAMFFSLLSLPEGIKSSLNRIKEFDFWSIVALRSSFSSLTVCLSFCLNFSPIRT